MNNHKQTGLAAEGNRRRAMAGLPRRSRAKAGFTLIELLVVIVIIGILIALLLPAIGRAIRRGHITACASNLSQMWKMMNIYRSQFGGYGKRMPVSLGGAFWQTMENTVPPLIDPTAGGLFLCPAKGDGMVGDLEYWGPGKRVARLGDMEPVGCDIMGSSPNHNEEGCNLLRKSSDVIEISQQDWANLDEAIGYGKVMTRPIP